MDIEVRVRRIERPGVAVQAPKYATPGAAALDLCAAIDEPMRVEPGKRRLIPTGIAVELPRRDLVGLVFARSGFAAKRGVCLANGVGVIDADYRGEIQCPLVNLGEEAVTIHPGDRIAQMAVLPIAVVQLRWVDALEKTVRGTGGFGSTGGVS